MPTGSQGMHSQNSNAFFATSGQSVPPNRSQGGDPNGGVTGAGWTAFGELVDADLPEFAPSATKVTFLNSAGKTHEYVPGQKEPGQVRLRFNYNTATMQRLANLVPGSGANPDTTANDWGRKQFLFLFPDNGYVYAFGFMMGFPQKVQEDDRVEIEVTFKCSGPLTYGTIGV